MTRLARRSLLASALCAAFALAAPAAQAADAPITIMVGGINKIDPTFALHRRRNDDG